MSKLYVFGYLIKSLFHDAYRLLFSILFGKCFDIISSV